MALNIRTDHKWHDFKSRGEVPAKVLKNVFDYQREDASDVYFKRSGTWHHLDQFMRDGTPAGWDGILNYSFSNGLLIKVSRDGERYQVGYYWTSAEPMTKAARKNPTDDTALQESPAKKRKWLAAATKRFPLRSRVRVEKADLHEYIGATGIVRGYDVGPMGSYPMIRVAFDPPLRKAPEDGSATHDGFYDDEISLVAARSNPTGTSGLMGFW